MNKKGKNLVQFLDPKRCQLFFITIKSPSWGFPSSPVVRTPYFHCWGSLVAELRSHMPCNAARNKQIKQFFIYIYIRYRYMSPSLQCLFAIAPGSVTFHRLSQCSAHISIRQLLIGLSYSLYISVFPLASEKRAHVSAILPSPLPSAILGTYLTCITRCLLRE